MTPVIGARMTGVSIRTGPIGMGVQAWSWEPREIGAKPLAGKVAARLGAAPMASGQDGALVVAAGSGSRAGGGMPKQYRRIAGKPLLAHAIDRLASIPASTRSRS